MGLGDSGRIYQVAIALILAVTFFILTYIASPRKTVSWLICLSPFQTIDSPYTTSNVLMVYVVAIAYVMRGRLRYVPMLPFFVVIIGIYLAAMGFADRSTYVQHAIYIFNYLSVPLMFFLVYNLVCETKDIRLIVQVLVILNILVIAHSVVQVNVGPHWTLFGIDELSIKGARRGDDPRLAGPYGVGFTAEFIVLNLLLLAYLSIHIRSVMRRNLLYLLMGVNLACLIATANRGGFLVLIGGAGLFLVMFRSTLGVKRTLTLSVVGVFLLAAMSIVVVKFTDYGQMYERLEATELEGGVPDTRTGTWGAIWPEIVDKPILGHGPRLRLQGDDAQPYPGTKVMRYPHNLYLFLLYTVGIVGLAAYLWFFAWLVARYRKGIRTPSGDPFVDGFIKLGILLMVIFLIDQLKVEFLRYSSIDYWHFVFTFFAIFLAVADLARTGQFRNARQISQAAVRTAS